LENFSKPQELDGSLIKSSGQFNKMSKIDKLQISGIRAFDHQRAEAIKFLSPLTLIVGSNGSGKTTIIECLKYVTTGMQPPNTAKGGAFIHDPKLAGEKEILAQVKLQFTAGNGSQMVAARSLSLTVSKAKRTMKTLEGSLLIKRHNERTVISSRVAEMDSILPQHLGVSTAVLDNVIFCHQDESLWPMSDPSTLKKKFDEIFEALKYTKAIKNIKDIRKKYNTDLGQYKIHEQNAKRDKERATRVRTKLTQLGNELDVLRENHDKIDKENKESRALAQQAWNDSEGYSRIVGILEGKQIEVESKQNIIAELKSHLKVVSESDEWLETTLAQFELRLEQYEERRKAKRGEYDACTTQLADGRSQLNQKLADRGKCEQEEAAFDRDVNNRKRKVREIAAHQQWRGFDDLADDSVVDEFMYKIRRVAKDQNLALERARREAEVEKRESQSMINRLTERKAALRESKQEARQQMSRNAREAEQHQQNVDKLTVDEGSSAVVQSKIESLQTNLSKAQGKALTANWDKSIGELNVELRSREEKSNQLNNDLIQGTKKAGETARLAHLKQEFKERQASSKILRDAHGKRISQLIGNGWQPGTIEEVYRTAVSEATEDVTAAETARDLVARELEQVQYKQKSTKNELEMRQLEAKKCEEEVRAAIENRDAAEYQDYLNTAQVQLTDLKETAVNRQGLESYFESLQTVANHPKNPACRACMRPFKGNDDPQLDKFRKRIETLIKNAQDDVPQEELEEAEKVHQQALSVGPAHKRWETLTTTEIPALIATTNELLRQREGILSKIEEHDKNVEQKQAVRKELDQISRTVASIGKFNADITTLDTQISELSTKQSQEGEVRTLEDIQEEITGLSEQMDKVKKQISRLTTEKEQSRLEVSRMELELRDLKNELSKTSYELEKKATLVARVEEYKTLNQKQRENVSKFEKEIEKLEPEIATANAKYDDVAERAGTKEKELQDQATQLSQSLNALELLNEQIKSYVDRDGPNQLTRTNKDIKRIEQEMKAIEQEQTQVTVEINNIAEQLRDSQNTRRQYSDNLRYRQDTRALERLKSEIEQLESQNARAHRDRYLEESNRLAHKISKGDAKIAGIVGELNAKDKQLTELVADFDTDLKDAPKRYREKHVEVEITKAAVEDLARYAGALDKAIMAFHSLKMGEINRVLETLWRDTYQGTDIDTILIRSESESATGAQSYAYRVVMVKQDVEMDMRGRCSAGQKVLACILVRIALAEVFSTNCGLLALDEPTTNLDEATIGSLAMSLHYIIQNRTQQANFQLLIITHDEEFLRQMHCEEFTDYFYRVSRTDRQLSQIEKQSIGEVI
jgi:DNA repair protein RAD50